MAIKEKSLPGGRWEVKATGEDIPKLSGMLQEHGKEKYREAFHKNEGVGFERISDPNGNETWIKKDQIEEYRGLGYGLKPLDTIRMVVPELPWDKKRLSPGRHKFRYDKASGQMVEVA